VGPAQAVDEFMRGGVVGVALIAAALNAGRGAQIGQVSVELTGAGGLALVSYSRSLQDRRTSLTWDPGVDGEVRAALPIVSPPWSGVDL